ncbi:Formimidoyltransferase-cyclodeaminase [Trichoplax sp. H2]|nr:Formimidoyltransferase-cyclodeaminase [Trichoplax sp. H2]|eukprot:RDD40180.1 Formimidoyltransferase-cyclodeaminase [Trichoplax sp. H2]
MIDYFYFKGEHPRLGSLDVCPFVPVQNVSMDVCVQCAKEFGSLLADKLKVPVFLYGFASSTDYRSSVPQIRNGEYEGLKEKLADPRWKPDFGPAEFVPIWGATIVGARDFLIAYNVNLISTKEQAHRIALNIRESGRGPLKPGRLKKVQAVGWYTEEANIAQVSTNISDSNESPLHIVYEEVLKDAKELSLPVVGSQVVGLVPLQAMLDAATYYIEKENLFVINEDQKIRLVIERLGLNSVGCFNPKEKIIEYIIKKNTTGPLLSGSLGNFITSIGSRTSSPGGGSASAAVAAIGAALGCMGGFLTYGSKKFESLDSTMRRLISQFNDIYKDLLPLIDKDTDAFNGYIGAIKLPSSTQEEKDRREKAMQTELLKAIEIPLTIMRISDQCWNPFLELAHCCNVRVISDVQTGSRSLEAGIWGAYYNVVINLKSVTDEEFKKETLQEINTRVESAQYNCQQILKVLGARTEFSVDSGS